MDSTTPNPPPDPPTAVMPCPDCGGRGTYRGHDVPIECQTCWTSGQHPWVRRLAEIRHRITTDANKVVERESETAMLRELLADVDRLSEALYVRRVETFLEASEVLRRVDMVRAAEVLDAQVMLEQGDPGRLGAAPGTEAHTRVLAGLAAQPDPADDSGLAAQVAAQSVWVHGLPAEDPGVGAFGGLVPGRGGG